MVKLRNGRGVGSNQLEQKHQQYSKEELSPLVVVRAGEDDTSDSSSFPGAVTLSQEELYLENCMRYHIAPDPAVVTALKTRWFYLETSRKTSEGAVLPLVGLLDRNQDVTHLKVNSLASAGNSNARALAGILRANDRIQVLDLAATGLTDVGIAELSEALKENSTLVSLNLSHNSFSEVGAERLREALLVNSSIKSLDLSCNALGFQTIESLRCSCCLRGMSIKTNGNFVFEDILNSVSHGVGFVLAVIGTYVLMSETTATYPSDYHYWACVVYSVSLNLLFLFSCLFHSFFMMPTTSRVLQILDHVGIYLLIAGSYTPFLLVSLHHVKAARLLLIAEWIAAFFGSIFAACADLNSKTTNAIELLFFLAMGFGLVTVWEHVVNNLPPQAFRLLLSGGAAYVFGIVFFILGEVNPIYHVIWHLFVVLGACLHWFCVYFFVVNKALEVDLPSLVSSTIESIIS